MNSLLNTLASRFAPLNEQLINENLESIDFHALSSNKNVLWTDSLIKKYYNNFDIARLSRNSTLPWNEQLFHDFKWHIGEFSKNIGFPWSIPFIDKNRDLLHWKSLSENPSVFCKKNWIHKYKDQIHFWALSNNRGINWDFSLLSDLQDKLSWTSLSEKANLPWSDLNFIGKLSKNINFPLALSNPSLVHQALQQNDYSTEQLSFLCRNPRFLFSDNFLKQNYDCLDWLALSQNNGLGWSKERIKEFDDQICYMSLAANENVEWSLPLINKILELGYEDIFAENQSVWNFYQSNSFPKNLFKIP